MTYGEFLVVHTAFVQAAVTLSQLPLKDFLQTMDRAIEMMPLADPTRFRMSQPQMTAVRELVVTAIPFSEKVNEAITLIAPRAGFNCMAGSPEGCLCALRPHEKPSMHYCAGNDQHGPHRWTWKD